MESLFLAVCQGDPAREDPARPGPGDRADDVRPPGGGGRPHRVPVSGQGPHPPLVRHVHPGHGLLRVREQPSHP